MVSDKKGVQQLLLHFKSQGIQKIVFSPGSRNAPFVLSFAQDDYFETFVIPDERSAAFYALGIADFLKSPVALVCTSGSALLNYAPAIAEAFYRNIPLLVLSADRPLEWIDQGDGQTIRQVGALSNHVVKEIQLLENPELKNEIWSNNKKLDDLFFTLKKESAPVHINFPLNEPLYGQIDTINKELLQSVKHVSKELTIDKLVLDDVVDAWNMSKKKMIICGQLPKNPELLQKLTELSQDSSVTVLVENTSNLVHRNFIQCIDRTLNSITQEFISDFQPDMLISIGGAIVSKKIKTFLRSAKVNFHFKVGEFFCKMDTFQNLTHSFHLGPDLFFKKLLKQPLKHNISRFGEQWKQLDYQIQDLHFDYLNVAKFSDLSVMHFITDYIPDNTVLHLANSSVVRYAQLFEGVASIDYYCNRGTSGIDGSTSTAMGAALVDKNNQHSLITGDISFFYDSNAFWNNLNVKNMVIFLINNGGGGIFQIIPGPSSTKQLNEYFYTAQSYNAEGICKTFGIEYHKATSFTELDIAIQKAYVKDDFEKSILIEIFTNEVDNAEELNTYFKQTKVSKLNVF